MVTPQNILRHELIGLEVTVADSTNKQIIGLHGKVVDESRQTLKISTEKGEKTAVKDQCVFNFCLPTGVCVRVEGKLLVSRPEDRVKKKLSGW
ncbi:MAG TPA: ribonuclease P protein component 1 [archaeon]|nr:ribonuclease P protein component 1 [archaeon]